MHDTDSRILDIKRKKLIHFVFHFLLQTHKNVSGSFRVKNEERLTFSGQFQGKHLPLNYRMLKVKATFNQRLKVSSYIHLVYAMIGLGV